jgi:hypothetical protein
MFTEPDVSDLANHADNLPRAILKRRGQNLAHRDPLVEDVALPRKRGGLANIASDNNC